ncbi:MAG: MerR family transcriptional regulator [Cellvibrionaceae bacterium]|nr:MerR family transcriptional regulator [Motiliproteus sp.]MCW9053624.1 MerR family transcriptional regulator [Motiliproteus sp.]
MSGLTIGKLAKAAEVNVETIRYYQRLGLLSEPAKPSEGYRFYPQTYVARIRFIKRAQGVGFTLKEIAQLFSLGEHQCDDIQALARLKRQEVDRQVRDLQAMAGLLDQLILRCDESRHSDHCALIEELSQEAKF